jgi:hypothetical protein
MCIKGSLGEVPITIGREAGTLLTKMTLFYKSIICYHYCEELHSWWGRGKRRTGAKLSSAKPKSKNSYFSFRHYFFFKFFFRFFLSYVSFIYLYCYNL